MGAGSGRGPAGVPLAFQVLTQPLNGTLSGTAPDLVYTPELNYHGPDSFTFSAHDGAADIAPQGDSALGAMPC